MTTTTTKAPAFTKGQAVTLFQSWDGKGTIRIADLTVYSCGKKEMILVDASGAKFEGRTFRPAVRQYNEIGAFASTEVHPRMSAEAAEAYALAHGAAVLEAERQHLGRCIDRENGEARKTPGYCEAIGRKIAALHEPRAERIA